jgi:hypothetical protein
MCGQSNVLNGMMIFKFLEYLAAEIHCLRLKASRCFTVDYNKLNMLWMKKILIALSRELLHHHRGSYHNVHHRVESTRAMYHFFPPSPSADCSGYKKNVSWDRDRWMWNWKMYWYALEGHLNYSRFFALIFDEKLHDVEKNKKNELRVLF